MICADELGPVIPRSFPPPPGWSTDGHRIKAPLEYGRGSEKRWVYGALRRPGCDLGRWHAYDILVWCAMVVGIRDRPSAGD